MSQLPSETASALQAGHPPYRYQSSGRTPCASLTPDVRITKGEAGAPLLSSFSFLLAAHHTDVEQEREGREHVEVEVEGVEVLRLAEAAQDCGRVGGGGACEFRRQVQREGAAEERGGYCGSVQWVERSAQISIEKYMMQKYTAPLNS